MEECCYHNLAGWYNWKQKWCFNLYIYIYTFIPVFSVTQTAVTVTFAVTEDKLVKINSKSSNKNS